METEPTPWQVGKTLEEALLYMYDNQISCNVTIKKNNDSFRAHQSVLVARSTYFEKLFQNETREGIDIDDLVSTKIFNDVIRFMYAETIDITETNVFEYLHAASVYSLVNLEKKCSEYLFSCVSCQDRCGKIHSPESIILLLDQAVAFDAKYLEQISLGIIDNSCLLSIMNGTPLSHKALCAFLDANDWHRSVSETGAFEMTLSWARQKCQEVGIPDTTYNLREILGDAIYKVRYPNMDVEDFVEYGVMNILSFEEVAKIIAFQKHPEITELERFTHGVRGVAAIKEIDDPFDNYGLMMHRLGALGLMPHIDYSDEYLTNSDHSNDDDNDDDSDGGINIHFNKIVVDYSGGPPPDLVAQYQGYTCRMTTGTQHVVICNFKNRRVQHKANLEDLRRYPPVHNLKTYRRFVKHIIIMRDIAERRFDTNTIFDY